MMEPESMELSLTQAEDACARELCRLLRLNPGSTFTVATSKGLPDAAIFDIGHLYSGEVASFPSNAYCFRSKLDMYNRDRTALQAWIMRLLDAMHIGHNYFKDSPLREDTNVVNFEIAPETGCVSDITTTKVEPFNTQRQIQTFLATIIFNVVFICKGEGEGNTDPEHGIIGATDETGAEVDNPGGSSGGGSIGDTGGNGGDDPPPDEG